MKLRSSIIITFAYFIITTSIIAQNNKFQYNCYIDKDGSEVILKWETTTGVSKLYYYDNSVKKFTLSSYQLPQKPLGNITNAFYQFDSYIDQDGSECALVWDANSGLSNIYYYDNSVKKFTLSSYQLPQKPLKNVTKAFYQFDCYIDKDGSECVLIWDATTGLSKLYYYDSRQKKFVLSIYQLP